MCCQLAWRKMQISMELLARPAADSPCSMLAPHTRQYLPLNAPVGFRV